MTVAAGVAAIPRRTAAALGLTTVLMAPRDALLLCAQRCVRMFAYGASALVLVSLLRAVDVPPARAGLFMTLTLVGDALLSFLLTVVADRLGRRAVLATGAILMTAAGTVFALASNFWLLLLAAVFGVVSPNGNEIGPFRAIEESTLAHLTPPNRRGDMFAWYLLIGTFGSAIGMMTCGWVVQQLSSLPDWTLLRAYRVVFVTYALMGLLKLAFTLLMSDKVELDEQEPVKPPRQTPPAVQSGSDLEPTETAPLLGGAGTDVEPEPQRSKFNLLPDISKESVPIVINLCLLFGLDAFASGLTPVTWVTYFFRQKFDLAEGKLGSLFFTSTLIAALSNLVSAAIARRLGNIKTMVFTHLPSTIFLILIPLPNDVRLAMAFMILRACTQSMDSAPRSAFLATILQPSERTVIIGTLNVVKTCTTSFGPLVTGVLVDNNLFWVTFVLAGSLKAAYDLSLLATFGGHEVLKQREEAQQSEAPQTGTNAENEDEEARS